MRKYTTFKHNLEEQSFRNGYALIWLAEFGDLQMVHPNSGAVDLLGKFWGVLPPWLDSVKPAAFGCGFHAL